MQQLIRTISGSLLLIASLLLMPDVAHADNPTDTQLESLLYVLPGADSFSDREGEPPVFKGYRTDPVTQERTLVGYAFLTSDVPPPITGYSGRIEVLVGMDLKGTLTGIKVVRYKEALRQIVGDFFRRPGFQEQFAGKSISDPFRVGTDVDGITRATASVGALARGVRDAARRVAMAYLMKPDLESLKDRSVDAGASGIESLERLSWPGLVGRGVITRLTVDDEGPSGLKLSFSYIGSDALGKLLLGQSGFAEVKQDIGPRAKDRHLMLVGIDGAHASSFRPEALAVRQGAKTYRISKDDFIRLVDPEDGKIAGRFPLVGVVLVDGAVAFDQPFDILYDLRPASGLYYTEYVLPSNLKWLVRQIVAPNQKAVGLPYGHDPDGSAPNNEIPLAFSFTTVEDETVLSKLTTGVSWAQVGALLSLFGLTIFAFLRKSAKLRWIALSYTFIYLGFLEGTFLSISHITGGIDLGFSWYFNDLQVLLVVGFTVLTILLWGRVFCGFLCPFGVLQDFLQRLTPRRFQRELPQRFHDHALYIKYGILALILFLTLLQSDVIIFHYFEPFGTLFYMSGSVLLWGILIAILLASIFVSRFYCRYACPLGAALGLASFITLFRIRRVSQCAACKLCSQSCPTGAIRESGIDFKECIRCGICEANLISHAGVCKHNLEEVRARLKSWKPVPV